MVQNQKGGGTKSKKPPTAVAAAAAGSCNHSLTLREEATGKIQPKGVGSRNPKSFLKLEHLQKLALWAGGQASIPSLAAFFGLQFAAASEALGVPPDPSLVLCERCETVLQPGFNCTIRIEKTRAKRRRKRRRPNVLMQNSVVYKCHFCSYQNRKRGTPKGHMKEICPPKVKPIAKVEPNESMLQESATSEKGANSKDEIAGKGEMDLPAMLSGDTVVTNTPATPSVGSGTTLLDAKKRKRNRSGSQKPEESDRDSVPPAADGSANASSKRKRKSWTTLKEIAASNERESSRNVANLTIPFLL